MSNEFITKSSGKTDDFETGAKRDSQVGKPRYDLIPPKALKRIALLYSRGAELYGDRNWENGIERNRLFSSAMRHLQQAFMNETDEDHLAAVCWNILAIMYFEEEEEKEEEIYEVPEDYNKQEHINHENTRHKEALESIDKYFDGFSYREE